jgi:hypothetical protein
MKSLSVFQKESQHFIIEDLWLIVLQPVRSLGDFYKLRIPYTLRSDLRYALQPHRATITCQH